MIKITGTRILAVLEEEENTVGNIIFKDTTSKLISLRIISTGARTYLVNKEDIVLVNRRLPNFPHKGTDYYIVEEKDVLAVKLKEK